MLRVRLETSPGRPSDAIFCASGAHELEFAPLRFSKTITDDSTSRVSKRTFRLLQVALPLLAVFAVPGFAGETPTGRIEPALIRPVIDPGRFGDKPADDAFGAYQRGFYKTALEMALKLANDGDPNAQALAAEIYARGLGTRENHKEAARLYALAADKGVLEAQLQTALYLLDGRYLAKDPQKAAELMKKAADRGNATAQFNFAQMQINASPGAPGIKKALPFFEKAAEQGLADAQYAMSQIIYNGAAGVKPDEAKAREWLVRAARQNFDTAQIDLSAWLIDGIGGPKDYKAAYGWLRRAASGGNIAAAARLAKLYRDGIGTDPSWQSAAAWYIKAKRAGLKDKDLDDFMDGLTEEEIQSAIVLANTLK